MEQTPPKPMTPFDELITSPSLQLLKLFLPYAPPTRQELLGVLIKTLELRETIDFFTSAKKSLSERNGRFFPASPNVIASIKPYMKPAQAEMLDAFFRISKIMDKNNEISPLDIMTEMLSPEQKDLFETYSELFEHGSDVEGGDK